MPWIDETLDGKTLDIYEPERRSGFALLFLHPVGLETLRDNAVFTRLLEGLGLPCVCPHGKRSWWADRICREFDATITAERFLLDRVVPWARARWALGPRGLGVFGISMGGQGALRLGFKHPRGFPVVAGIASAIEYQELFHAGTPIDEMYESKEQCRQDTALLHIHPYEHPPHIHFCCDPADDLCYRGNDRLHEKLNALGVAHTADLATRAGGHTWSYFDAMAEPTLKFLAAGLAAESRRLL